MVSLVTLNALDTLDTLSALVSLVTLNALDTLVSLNALDTLSALDTLDTLDTLRARGSEFDGEGRRSDAFKSDCEGGHLKKGLPDR